MCRYDRVRAVQKTGEMTRDMWHKTGWAKVKENPDSIGIPRDDWIHAEKVFDQVFQA